MVGEWFALALLSLGSKVFAFLFCVVVLAAAHRWVR